MAGAAIWLEAASVGATPPDDADGVVGPASKRTTISVRVIGATIIIAESNAVRFDITILLVFCEAIVM
jgi:hypothetical protein